MKEYEKEIDRILETGLKKGLEASQIVDEILGTLTKVRKSETISINEYEKIIQEAKESIRQARRLMMRGLTG